MYTEALEKGTLPPTIRRALISLVPKKGKDPADCRNYQPNRLMQIHVNIISKSCQTVRSVPSILRIIDSFSLFSGYRVNPKHSLFIQEHSMAQGVGITYLGTDIISKCSLPLAGFPNNAGYALSKPQHLCD